MQSSCEIVRFSMSSHVHTAFGPVASCVTQQFALEPEYALRSRDFHRIRRVSVSKPPTVDASVAIHRPAQRSQPRLNSSIPVPQVTPRQPAGRRNKPRHRGPSSVTTPSRDSNPRFKPTLFATPGTASSESPPHTTAAALSPFFLGDLPQYLNFQHHLGEWLLSNSTSFANSRTHPFVSSAESALHRRHR